MNNRALAVLVWCSLAVVSNVYVTIPIAGALAGEWELGASAQGWIGSSFSLAYAAGFLIFAPVADRVGPKRMMLAGLAALALVAPLAGLADSLPAFLALRVVQGLAASSFAPSVITYVAAKSPEGRRATAIGFVSFAFLLSGIAGQLYAGFLYERLGWPPVFFGLGIAYALSAILLGRLVPGESAGGAPSPGAPRPEPLLGQIGTLLANRSLLACYAIAATALLSFVGMYTALNADLARPPYSLDADGLLYVRAIGIAGMLLSPLAGVLSRKRGLVPVLRAGIALAFAGLLVAYAARSLPALVAASVVFVAGISLLIPSLISVVGQLAGPYRGAGITLYSFVLFCGAAVGPPISLGLLSSSGPGLAFAAFSLVLAFALAASFLISGNSKTAVSARS